MEVNHLTRVKSGPVIQGLNTFAVDSIKLPAGTIGEASFDVGGNAFFA